MSGKGIPYIYDIILLFELEYSIFIFFPNNYLPTIVAFAYIAEFISLNIRNA